MKKAIVVEDMDGAPPGAIAYEANGDGIFFMCPCGCGAEGFLPTQGAPGGPRWNWNGNREQPTLTPSVLQTGACRWHGWLRDGMWISA